jgi:hypothetical protein
MDLEELSNAIAEQLSSRIARPTHTYGQPTDGTNYPRIIVEPGSTDGPLISYADSFGSPDDGGLTIRFTLRLEVIGRARDSHIALYDYLSTGSRAASSIVGAIYADPTIGGRVTGATIRSADVQDIPDGPQVALLPLELVVV